MKTRMTEQQRMDLVGLAAEHWDTLTAWGADMYRDGIIKGVCLVGAGAAIGLAVSIAEEVIPMVMKKFRKR